MNKKFVVLSLLAGLVLTASSVKAAVYNLNVKAVEFFPAASASNGWDVLFSSNDKINWTIDSIKAFGSPSTDATNIIFTFYDSLGVNSVLVTSGSGQANAVAWDFNGSGSQFSTLNPLGYLDNAGGPSVFTGSFSVNNANADRVTVTVNGPGGIYAGSTNLTPEIPGAAMLIPALLPVGIMLGRKRRKSNG